MGWRYIFSIIAEEVPPLSTWMDELVGHSGRFRSLLQWAKSTRPPMAGSTIHQIRESGTTSPENVIRLARAAGVNPKDVFIRIGWFDEEIDENDESLLKLRQALARVPADLRPMAADLAEGILERLSAPGGQQVARSYLQVADHPEEGYEASPKPEPS